MLGASSPYPRTPEAVAISRQTVAQLAKEQGFARPQVAPKVMLAAASRSLPTPDLTRTPEVERELKNFLTSDRLSVQNIIERRADLGDKYRNLLSEEGVPADLLNLAGIESGLNPQAKSPAGARGMWQFMKSTAQLYGLVITGRKDERLDPIRSTMAAARHLKELFNVYNDWHLALAAYNAGPGKVDRALSQSGAEDFWELSRSGKLARETARFVPRYIALSLIMQDPEGYGFKAVG